MIKSLNDIVVELNELETGGEQMELLKEWADSIVEECSNVLLDDGAIQEGWLWQKILKVKEQIK